jgi:hypothetical protein
MKNMFAFIVAILFVSISAAAQNTPSNVSPNDELWEKVNTYIGKRLLSVDPQLAQHRVVHYTAFPVYAYWSEPNGVFTLYLLADSVPANSPLWLWSPGKKFSFSYAAFIDALDAEGSADAPTRARRKQLEAAYNSKANHCAAVQQGLLDGWDTYKAQHAKSSQRLTFDQWWNGHNGEFGMCNADAGELFNRWSQSLDPNGQSIAEIRKAVFDARSNRIKVLLPVAAQDALANTADKADWKYDYRFPFVTNNLQSFMDEGEKNVQANTPEDTWTIDHSTSATNFTQEGWSGSGGFGGFIQLGGGASTSKTVAHSDEVSISFKFFKMELVPVTPASTWYNEQALTLFECGPFRRGSVLTPTALWGDTGLLSLRPSEVLLAYKPQLTLHFETHDYEEVLRVVQGGGGITIGPFSIGGSAGRVDHSITHDDMNHNISVVVNSRAGMVLAVLSQKINPDFATKCAH